MKVVVIGAQWGDEGKGKIVDFLADESDIIVRFSGGANAGHTIVIGEDTYKLHLIPSGIIYPDKIAVLGTGMVIDPEALFTELNMLTDKGIKWEGRIKISDRAHIVLPEYKEIDKKMDSTRRKPIGTTGRGIGITYSQKALRNGVRIGDLYDPDVWGRLTKDEQNFLTPFKEKMEGMAIDIASFMAENKAKRVLFEGAQGILLDLDSGTYPFVSSGYSCAAGASIGGGIGPRDINRVLGVFKAYSTRVGNGPFPSEFDRDVDSELEDFVRETGREYGVTTGRPRRCGFLDLVALKYACRTNSIDSLVLTHIDVYDSLESIKICTAYEIDGKEVTDLPSSITKLENAKPVLKTFKGWKTNLSEMKDTSNFPQEAKDYIKFIEDYTETSVDIVSVGYKRSQTIINTPIWS